MIRLFGFVLVVLATFGLSWNMLNKSLPGWEAETKYLVQAATEAKLDTTVWQALIERADTNLPGFYPFSSVHHVLKEGRTISETINQLDVSLDVDWSQNQVATSQFEPLWDVVDQLDASLAVIMRQVRRLPRWAMTEPQRLQRDQELGQLERWQDQLRDLQRLEQVWEDFQRREERVLILLQNRNESRPTGGFVGSLVLLDFTKEAVSWQFLDIYELDRLLDTADQNPAPAWFAPLSSTISLRDANFWPDFPTTAETYRQMFRAIGEKPPKTILTVNLSVIEQVLTMTAPVTIEPWGVELNPYNFDLVLQFLVESKISGRFAVKQPVLQFAQKLLAPSHLSQLNLEAVRAFDLPAFIAEKNVLGHSQHLSLQKLFERWNLDGQIRRKVESDNFLQFDFVSVGANKSDKFVWTKLSHDSDIAPDGRVINTLKIKRTHALQPGEMETLLGINNWSQNVAELFTPELAWKLGAGENRTVLRVMTPVDSRLLDQRNPSGPITSALSDDGAFKIWEIPLNVVPGETIETVFEYETTIKRGSQRWRPYFLQLVGTPARQKTDLVTSISTAGDFTAQTRNLGRPVDLIDQDFRAVIEF